jgi:hypothetical protein
MKPINFDHLQRCCLTLERSLQSLKACEPGSIDYEVIRNAVVKSFELTLEITGKLLRKVLKEYTGAPKKWMNWCTKMFCVMPRFTDY